MAAKVWRPFLQECESFDRNRTQQRSCIAKCGPLVKITQTLRRVVTNSPEHDVGRNGAALAYCLVFAPFHLLIYVSNLLGMLYLDEHEIQGSWGWIWDIRRLPRTESQCLWNAIPFLSLRKHHSIPELVAISWESFLVRQTANMFSVWNERMFGRKALIRFLHDVYSLQETLLHRKMEIFIDFWALACYNYYVCQGSPCLTKGSSDECPANDPETPCQYDAEGLYG